LRSQICPEPKCGLYAMRSKRQHAAQQCSRNIYARINLICRGISNYRTGGNTNKRVYHIPIAIEIRYFVRKKFNQIKAARNTDDPPVVQNVQSARELGCSKLLQQTENGHRRVKIYPGSPGGTES